MKKFLSIILLFVLAFSLTACGSKTLVATMEEDSEYGKMKLTSEFKFNSDEEVERLTITMKFEEKDYAEETYEFITGLLLDEDSDELEGIEIKQSGKEIIIKMDKSSEALDDFDDMSYDELKESLEDDGWDVK